MYCCSFQIYVKRNSCYQILLKIKFLCTILPNQHIFSCEVAALDLIYSISFSNPFLNLVMQLKCLSPIHSVSALIKFHTSISKSVTVHNFVFVQGQTLQVGRGKEHQCFSPPDFEHIFWQRFGFICPSLGHNCKHGLDITGIDTMYMTIVYLWYVRGQTLQV